MKLFMGNQKPPVKLTKDEEIGPPKQDLWVDPLSESEYVHEGISLEELLREGYVGIYLNLKGDY